MYTKDDIHLRWVLTSNAHKKYKHLELLTSAQEFFEGALRENKEIIVKAYNLQNSYAKTSLKRYRVSACIGVMRHFDFQTYNIFSNYWRLWPYQTPEEQLRIAAAYMPLPFNSVTVTIPCTRFDTEHKTQVPEDLTRPRVSFIPSYGKQYVHNLDNSIAAEDLLNWMPIVNVVVQKIHKQFVNTDGEVV